jgi:glycosyltransferase involved in cell wall biosynthesis
MRVLFNVYDVGLGNNGGSSTLVKSANELVELGIEVKVVSSCSNQYTWNKLLAEHVIVKSISKFPRADVVIATGMKSIESTIRCLSPVKVHWIRGFETWIYSENKLIRLLKESNTVKIVNSICLERKLRKYNIVSFIIRPGYDLEDYYPKNLRNDKIILGGVYNEGNKRKTKRTEWIFQCLYALLKKHKNIKLWMYGAEGNPKGSLISFYKKDASEEDKNYIYNNVSIWLSPSCLEGLHMPPAEAGLTECCVVGTEAEMNGTQDYLTHNLTGIVSENNLKSFIEAVDYCILNKEVRNKLGKELRTKIVSLGDRKNNMSKLLELLTTLGGKNNEQQMEVLEGISKP